MIRTIICILMAFYSCHLPWQSRRFSSLQLFSLSISKLQILLLSPETETPGRPINIIGTEQTNHNRTYSACRKQTVFHFMNTLVYSSGSSDVPTSQIVPSTDGSITMSQCNCFNLTEGTLGRRDACPASSRLNPK